MKLAQEVLDWLLERENPAVRLGTLRDLCSLGEDDPEVQQARQAMMAGELVTKIFSKQTPGGYWGKPEDFYVRSKYKGTVWNVILLAEMGADGSDGRIRHACEFLLNWSQDAESGGFAFYDSKRDARREQIGPCLTGNLVWSMLRFGMVDDPRVRKGVEWIATYQRADDGTNPPKEWPYAKYEACWGRHTCMMGVVKGLKALVEVPAEKRTPQINAKIAELAEFLLQHHLFKRSHDLEIVAKDSWTRFGFPRFWATDTLEMLGILVRLGYRDERMQDAIDIVLLKQGADGRWKQVDDNYNGRMLTRFEKKGESSKWVTLEAMKMLAQYMSRQ